MVHLIPISSEWLSLQAAKLDPAVSALVQGYEWTGLGHYREGRLDFGKELEWRWTEYFDVRLFSPKGEWHCWRSDDGTWSGRYVAAGDWPKNRRVERCYVLHGRERDGAWVRESSGARVFMPQVPAATELKKRPVRLRTWLRVEHDGTTGLAYVADAMLREIYQGQEDE